MHKPPRHRHQQHDMEKNEGIPEDWLTPLDSKYGQDMWTHSKTSANCPSEAQQKVPSEDIYESHIVHCVPKCEGSLWNLLCKKRIKTSDFHHSECEMSPFQRDPLSSDPHNSFKHNLSQQGKKPQFILSYVQHSQWLASRNLTLKLSVLKWLDQATSVAF